tara:strand:- start:3532 stop:3678 length:147 start_codon:yes stop_codon:yes gene_type:complete
MAASSVRLSKDTFLFLVELAGTEVNNMDMEEDQEYLWEEVQEKLQELR